MTDPERDFPSQLSAFNLTHRRRHREKQPSEPAESPPEWKRVQRSSAARTAALARWDQHKQAILGSEPTTLGRLLHQRRLLQGWTQSQLAVSASTSEPMISRVERGTCTYRPLLERLARALGLELNFDEQPNWYDLERGEGEQ